MDPIILIPVIIYFLVISGIGIYSSKYSSTGLSEFFIGGGQMSRVLVAVSAVVSGRSAWLLLIFIGQAYTFGFSSIWSISGYLIVEFFMFRYLAPRIKKNSEKLKIITIPDYIASRFKNNNGFLRLVFSITLIIFVVVFIAYQIVSGGKFFYNNLDLPLSTRNIITAVILLFFTITGGFLAAGIADILLSCLLLIVFILVPVYSISDLGGMQELGIRISSMDQKFFDPLALTFGALLGFVGFGFLSPGNPHLIVRYMAIKDPAQFRWVSVSGTIWSAIMALGAFSTGIVARISFPNIESIPGKDAGNALLTLSNTVLPGLLTGLVLAVIIGSIISAAASHLMIAASSFVVDVYEKVFVNDRKITKKKLVYHSRIVIVGVFYIAVLLSLLLPRIVSGFMLIAWAGLAASLGPVIFSLFWEKTTKAGVITGFLSGILTFIIWQFNPFLTSLTYAFIPGFFMCVLMIIVVSLLETRVQKFRHMKKHNLMKAKKIGIGLNTGN